MQTWSIYPPVPAVWLRTSPPLTFPTGEALFLLPTDSLSRQMGLLYRSRSGANYVRYPFLSGRFTARCFPSTKPQKTTGAPQQIPQGLLHLQATPGQGLSNCHAETSSSDVDRTQCDEVRPVCGACSFRDEPCSFPPPDEQVVYVAKARWSWHSQPVGFFFSVS